MSDDLTLENITALNQRIHDLVKGDELTGSKCQELIEYVQSLNKQIEENSKDLTDSEEMINLCLLSEYFLELRLSEIAGIT